MILFYSITAYKYMPTEKTEPGNNKTTTTLVNEKKRNRIKINLSYVLKQDFSGGSDSKASIYNAGDPGSIPGSGRSPGEGNGTPLQHYCLENPMDTGAWQATVHGVAKSQTRLSEGNQSINVLKQQKYTDWKKKQQQNLRGASDYCIST